mmetsp:Transcript_54679/g.88299  ORF Transcript_54679/g.88299 Transcript_54679/m.88299 type:complete len:91 (-) Transcript_54679:660-932(-)
MKDGCLDGGREANDAAGTLATLYKRSQALGVVDLPTALELSHTAGKLAEVSLCSCLQDSSAALMTAAAVAAVGAGQRTTGIFPVGVGLCS